MLYTLNKSSLFNKGHRKHTYEESRLGYYLILQHVYSHVHHIYYII